MNRRKKSGYRIRVYLAAAATMTAAVLFTGCGENAYADQPNAAEFTSPASAAFISDGFYTIEVPSYMDPDGKTRVLDTENGVYSPNQALPTAESDHSAGQQFMVRQRMEGIYTIQNANSDQNIKIRTGLSYVSNDNRGDIPDGSEGTVEVELWSIFETAQGDIMIAPYMLKTSLFEQITVNSFPTGSDFVRPWIFTKTQVGISARDVFLEFSEAEYTGELITPKVTVSKAGKILQENVDYVVVYENNREIGTAKVRVSGIGEYEGDCVAEFTINAIDIADGGDVVISESDLAAVSDTDENGIVSYAYTGSPLEPSVQVLYNGSVLTEGTDYSVTFTDNVDPGTARIDITGEGIYRGSFHRGFVIGGVETEINLSKTYTFAPKSHGADRLAVKDGGITSGVTFNTSASSDDEKEKFRFFANEDGTYSIISVKSGYCMEDIAGSVRLDAYGHDAAQNWVPRKNSDDTFTFVNSATGQVLTAGENTKDEGAPVTTVKTGTDSVPKETQDMHFYLVETEGVDAFAEGYYSATYNDNIGYSIAYGTQSGKTGLYIQDGALSQTMSLVYSGDGWYRVLVGTDDKVLTSDQTGNLSEALWAGTDSQLWRFERSDGTPITAEMVGITDDSGTDNISDDGTPGVDVGAARFTARLVNKDGIALTAPFDSIDRAINFTAAEFLQSVANVYMTAHNNHYLYGNSTTAVPCADGFISCDRLIARAVYDLGLTDQPPGGFVVENMTEYLQRYGFVTFTDIGSARAGDIMMVTDPGGVLLHTFVVESYDSSTGICSKYDLGSQSRIDTLQPISTAMDEWSDKDVTYGIRNPYTKAPAYAIVGSYDSDSTSQLWIFEK